MVNQKEKIIQVGNEPIQVPGFILKEPIFRVRNQDFPIQPYDLSSQSGNKPQSKIGNDTVIVLSSRARNPEVLYEIIQHATDTHNISLPS